MNASNPPIYIPQMQSIAERVNKPPVLVQCIQMFNEEEFAPLVLASIYNEVDKIIVVEGAVGVRPDATADGHSTDRTLEILKDFKANKDPDGKIMIVSIKRPWKSLEEMKQVFLDITTPGDWLIINDADEIYKPEDIRRVRRNIDLYPHAIEFIPSFIHFYRDFNHLAVPGPEWQPQHQRIIKNQGGMRYLSHPVATMADGYCTYFSPHLQHRRFTMHHFYIYHYGYARSNMDDVMRKKQAYYETELAKHGGANKKFDQKVVDWFENREPLIRMDLPNWHPEIMRKHPMFDFRAEIKHPIVGEFHENDYYGISLGEQTPIPNIWLCMTGQAAPAMSMYSNMVPNGD